MAAAAPQDAVDLVHFGQGPGAFRGENSADAGRASAHTNRPPGKEIKNIKKLRKSTNYLYSPNLTDKKHTNTHGFGVCRPERPLAPTWFTFLSLKTQPGNAP
jgi:hypothetical protein